MAKFFVTVPGVRDEGGDEELPPLDIPEKFARVFEEEFERLLDETHGPAPARTRPPTPSHWPKLSERVGRKAISHLANPDQPLEKIGRFEALLTIGEGGFGTVFKVRDPDLDRLAALKLCRLPRPDARDLLLHEARVLAKLKHPNILTIYEVGEYKNGIFFVTDYVKGSDMHDYAVDFPRGWESVLEAFLVLGKAVATAHAQGVIHGDIKPANMLVERETRTPYLVDFGMARLVNHSATDGELPRLGTLQFLAPELLRGGTPDERSDQYAFCVSLWQSLEGHLPFLGQDQEQLLSAVQGEPLATRGGIPERLRAVVRQGLSPAPEDRYPNMSTLLRALELARGPVLVPDPTEHELRSSESGARSLPKGLGPVFGLMLIVSMTAVLAEVYMAHREAETTTQLVEPDPAPRELAEAKFSEAKTQAEQGMFEESHQVWYLAKSQMADIDRRRAAEMSLELSRLFEKHLNCVAERMGDACGEAFILAAWMADDAAKSFEQQSLGDAACEAREQAAAMFTRGRASHAAQSQLDWLRETCED